MTAEEWLNRIIGKRVQEAGLVPQMRLCERVYSKCVSFLKNYYPDADLVKDVANYMTDGDMQRNCDVVEFLVEEQGFEDTVAHEIHEMVEAQEVKKRLTYFPKFGSEEHKRVYPYAHKIAKEIEEKYLG